MAFAEIDSIKTAAIIRMVFIVVMLLVILEVQTMDSGYLTILLEALLNMK